MQMEKIDRIIEKRIELAGLYNSLLSDVNGLQIPCVADSNKHIYQSYVVLLDGQLDRDTVIKTLKEKEIETTIGTYALHCQPFYQKEYGYEEGELKNSCRAFNQSLCLPLYQKMGKEDIKKVINIFREVIEK